MDFTALLEEAWGHERLRPLAVVPFVASFVYVDRFRRLARVEGVHFGVSFGFPQPVATVWTFVNVPARGGGVDVPSPAELALFPAVAVLLGVAAAAYLGSIDAGLDGGYDPVDAARAHALPLVAVEFLRLAAVGAVAALALVALPLVLVGLVGLLVVSYLFFAAPYLVVAADEGLLDALGRSYRWATEGGPYLEFFVKYLLTVAALSLLATPVVANLGVVGAALGAALLAPVALVLNVATMLFVRSRADGGADGNRGQGPADGPGGDQSRADGEPGGQSNISVDM